MDKQKVYESKTISGIRGLFTNRMLAASLFEGDDAKVVAEKLGFELVPNPYEPKVQ